MVNLTDLLSKIYLQVNNEVDEKLFIGLKLRLNYDNALVCYWQLIERVRDDELE